MDATNSVIRIKPYQYIHVLDNNTNVTRVEIGPNTFTRQDHEKVVAGPDPMIMIPLRNYCTIGNPVVRKADGSLALDEFNQVKLRHGDEEIRVAQDPFPLYPGEKLVGKVTALQVVPPLRALRLRALRDFTEGKVTHVAGDEWLYEGPGTYLPRIEVRVEEEIKANIIGPNQALKLRANKACIDRLGTARKAGEEWLVRQSGSYLPGVDEKIVETVNAYILTDKKALHLKAIKSFTDESGKTPVQRKAGEEWLVTSSDRETHIADVYETVVSEIAITTLSKRQYCVVLDPVGANGKPQLGQKELRKGEVSFFLRPGESLEGNRINPVYILNDQEALLLRAKETFTDGAETHLAGDRWMIYGPTDFIPPVQVEVAEKRTSIPLDDNEGIYVRDIKTGKVASLSARTYMLRPNEELWEKELPKTVEEVFAKETNDPDFGSRDKTRVVTYRAPHNSAVQIYDYKEKKARVVFGPELVMLGPDEHFTVLSLSGEKPKRPHVIKSIALYLGPDFMTDVVIVETSDHAKLSLKLSYNWQFVIDKTKKEDAQKIFQVPDFVGDSCKAIASRVRGAVAAVPFDDFHKRSAEIIRHSVFGFDETGKPKENFVFNSNGLVVTNIDIQSVEPVDQRTRDSLQKSVQLAIEITTKSQEAAARHEAEKLEQGARGRLERQKINDEAAAELAKKELLELQAQSAAVESTGQATAEAQAQAEAQAITAEANVNQAKLKAQATKIRSESELLLIKQKREAELQYKKKLDELEIQRAKDLTEIDAKKFRDIVGSIGADTIKSIAQAGPEMQAKLLSGLGLKSFMITDGSSPINLFNTANGLVGGNIPK
ncbi:major vault protein [Cavenderia fasciculata]|uniref:Major vault protein n=1 Tax=Cavenderia fasciculata TaxID=261658 RepID=F4QCT9_CACFS|nr:major vault protein [Cavenderia fasciculata]EGG14463.1 major vault protein [Cavenderia fasciculata]|eukprot:XP_004353872.1 major vault protein [Cavenderia fasciculata]